MSAAAVAANIAWALCILSSLCYMRAYISRHCQHASAQALTISAARGQRASLAACLQGGAERLHLREPLCAALRATHPARRTGRAVRLRSRCAAAKLQ